MAVNRLGLSQQVPARYIYISDGPTKQLEIGNRTIRFQDARPKVLRADSVLLATVIQALRYLGRNAVDQSVTKRLHNKLAAKDRKRLIKDTRDSTD